MPVLDAFVESCLGPSEKALALPPNWPALLLPPKDPKPPNSKPALALRPLLSCPLRLGFAHFQKLTWSGLPGLATGLFCGVDHNSQLERAIGLRCRP